MNHGRNVLKGAFAGAVCGIGYRYGIKNHPQPNLILKYSTIAGATGIIAGLSYATVTRKPKLLYSLSLGINWAGITALFVTSRYTVDNLDYKIQALHPYVKSAGCGALTALVVSVLAGRRIPLIFTDIIIGTVLAPTLHIAYVGLLVARRKAALAYHLSKAEDDTAMKQVDKPKKSLYRRSMEYLAARPTKSAELDERIIELTLAIQELKAELGEDENAGAVEDVTGKDDSL